MQLALGDLRVVKVSESKDLCLFTSDVELGKKNQFNSLFINRNKLAGV